VQKATDVWSAIGCQVLKMTPDNHDAAFAAVSHLPHLLAFAYFSAVARQPAGNDYLSLAGPGFRDFTRIAASDPGVWRDILVANREEILKQSLRFRTRWTPSSTSSARAMARHSRTSSARPPTPVPTGR
jgi:prephenate dehydrogenase